MIRKAEEKDLKDLLEIINDAILNSTATFDVEVRDYEYMKGWYESFKGNHILLVYEMNNKAVGYACFSTYRNKKAFDSSVELSLYVNKNYRGKGIGEKLLKEIIEIGKENKQIHNIISVITSENEVSIKLHKKYGFRYCGTILHAGYKFERYLDVDTYQIIV